MCLLITLLNSVNEHMILFHCNMAHLTDLIAMIFLSKLDYFRNKKSIMKKEIPLVEQ
jgi:hypothetical protein